MMPSLPCLWCDPNSDAPCSVCGLGDTFEWWEARCRRVATALRSGEPVGDEAAALIEALLARWGSSLATLGLYRLRDLL